jgi:hypothetical protein
MEFPASADARYASERIESTPPPRYTPTVVQLTEYQVEPNTCYADKTGI